MWSDMTTELTLLGGDVDLVKSRETTNKSDMGNQGLAKFYTDWDSD